MNARAKQLRTITSLMHIALLVLMGTWYSLLRPSTGLPAWLPTVILALPLAIALPGIIQGKRYTYGWLPLLLMLYWTHGIMEAWSNPEDRMLAGAELVLSLLLFWACIFYLRLTRDGPRQKRKRKAAA